MYLRHCCTSALLGLIATFSQAASVHKFAANATDVKYVVNFGDSYSQTGFNINGTLPSASNIIGNPAFPGYTTANGNRYNWLDTFVARENKSSVYAVNLASGGATVDATLVKPYEPYPKVQSFVNQTNSFLGALSPAPAAFPWAANNTLFTVWMGVNDVGNAWGDEDWPTLLQAIGAQYFDLVARLFRAGARRFAVLSVPPTYLTPLMASRGKETQDALKGAILDFNEMLGATAAGSLLELRGVRIDVVYTEQAWLNVINDPKKYGAKDATCLSQNGTDCIWFNDYHPGQAIHDEVAKEVAKVAGNW